MERPNCEFVIFALLNALAACALDGREELRTSDDNTAAVLLDNNDEITTVAETSDDEMVPGSQDSEGNEAAELSDSKNDAIEDATSSVLNSGGPMAEARRVIKKHAMKSTGVAGRGRWIHFINADNSPGGFNLRAYVNDTKTDGSCAEVWLDFTTNPHEHHGPLLTYACAKKGWGAAHRHADPSNSIQSFRMAVCRAKHPGQRYSSTASAEKNAESRPADCRQWNSPNTPNWAVTAWMANDDKITQVP